MIADYITKTKEMNITDKKIYYVEIFYKYLFFFFFSFIYTCALNIEYCLDILALKSFYYVNNSTDNKNRKHI